jgi:transcriptional regulator with XRE-family HTH domain
MTYTVARLARARSLAETGRGRRIREAAGLSYRELADAVGVNGSTILRWETGTCRPRADAALRWAATLAHLEREITP